MALLSPNNACVRYATSIFDIQHSLPFKRNLPVDTIAIRLVGRSAAAAKGGDFVFMGFITSRVFHLSGRIAADRRAGAIYQYRRAKYTRSGWLY